MALLIVSILKKLLTEIKKWSQNSQYRGLKSAIPVIPRKRIIPFTILACPKKRVACAERA